MRAVLLGLGDNIKRMTSILITGWSFVPSSPELCRTLSRVSFQRDPNFASSSTASSVLGGFPQNLQSAPLPVPVHSEGVGLMGLKSGLLLDLVLWHEGTVALKQERVFPKFCSFCSIWGRPFLVQGPQIILFAIF